MRTYLKTIAIAAAAFSLGSIVAQANERSYFTDPGSWVNSQMNKHVWNLVEKGFSKEADSSDSLSGYGGGTSDFSVAAEKKTVLGIESRTPAAKKSAKSGSAGRKGSFQGLTMGPVKVAPLTFISSDSEFFNDSFFQDDTPESKKDAKSARQSKKYFNNDFLQKCRDVKLQRVTGKSSRNPRKLSELLSASMLPPCPPIKKSR